MPNSLKDDSSKDDSSNPCLLTTVYQKNEAAMLGALLEDSGIPYFIKEKGNGGYLKIYMGYTIFGEEIYVNENQYEQAKELVELYFSNNEDNLNDDNLDQDNLDENNLDEDNLDEDNSDINNMNEETLFKDNSTEDNFKYNKRKKDSSYDQEDQYNSTSQTAFMRKGVVWVARSILLTSIIALIVYLYRILIYFFHS